MSDQDWPGAANPVVAMTTFTVAPQPCAGCGYSHLTATVNPMYPHNEAACVAYKRGYEAGLAASKVAP